MKKVIMVVLAILLLGAVGFKVKQKIDLNVEFSQESGGRNGRNDASVAVVKTLKIASQPIKETLCLVGEITAETEIAVQPRINGRLLRLTVDEGQFVKKGQMIAILDDETIRLQLQQNEASLATIKANLNQSHNDLARAKTEKERYQELLSQKYISKRDYENVEDAYLSAQTSVETVKAQLASAEKSYELTRFQLNQTKVYAPTTGCIIKKEVTEGVNVTTGTTIVTVVSLNRVKLKFNIDQRDAVKARRGTKVIFSTDAFPNEKISGKITDTAPSYDTATRTLSLTVLLPNPSGRLIPGMFGTVDIIVGENPRALVVPEEAIVSRNEQPCVFVVTKKGTAKLTPVTTGLTADGMREVISGLSENELVVVVGQNRLRNGDPVQFLDSKRGALGENGRRPDKRRKAGGRQ